MERIDAASLLEIATETVNQSSMRFDPNSGMYYDEERDMYYDIHSSIYYNYKTGIYYKMDDVENLVEVYRDDSFNKKPEKDKGGQIVEEDTDEEPEKETTPPVDEYRIPAPIESAAVGYDPSEKRLGGRAGSVRVIVTKCRISSGLTTGSLHLITIDGCTIGSAA